MSQKTFKTAYQTLQKHAETLRNQQEPNIDDLLKIVTESVDAYNVCKERIDAVEQAMQKALSGAEIEEDQQFSDAISKQSTPSASENNKQASSDSPPDYDSFDEDIPF